MTVGVVALRTVWLGAVTPHMAAPQVLQNLARCSFDRPHFVQKAADHAERQTRPTSA